MALFIPALLAAGAHNISAVVYDGVGDYLKHTGGPTGAADGTTGTIVVAGTFNSDGSAMSLRRVINGNGTVLSLRRTATNTIEFKGWQSDATTAVFSNVSAAVAASLGFLIIIATCNGTSSTLDIIHAAGTISGTNTPGTAGNIDWTADWWYGQDGASGEFLDMDVAMLWDDLTVVSTTEQFWDSTNDTLRDPGSDGSNPLDGDHAPLVCHVNPASSHTVNRGSGGDADVGTTFEDGTSPGAYSPDYVPPAEFALVADPAEINANGNVRTYSGLSFGAADSGRVLYGVHLASCGGVATAVLASATLDGANLTVVASGQAVDGSNNRVFIHVVKIKQADMSTPSATSGDVVFTINNVTTSGSKFMLFRGVGYNDIAADTLSVLDTTPNSGAIDFPADGLFFGGVMDYGGSIGYTWSPTVTEGFDDAMRFAGRGGIAYASGLTGGLGTTVTATVGAGGGAPCALVCATFAVA